MPGVVHSPNVYVHRHLTLLLYIIERIGEGSTGDRIHRRADQRHLYSVEDGAVNSANPGRVDPEPVERKAPGYVESRGTRSCAASLRAIVSLAVAEMQRIQP